MLKILTDNKTWKPEDTITLELPYGSPLADLSNEAYFSLTLDELTGNKSMESLSIIFRYIPIVNRVVIPKDQADINLILGDTIEELKRSKILTSMDLAVKVVNTELPGDLEVFSDYVPQKNVHVYRISCDLFYYRLPDNGYHEVSSIDDTELYLKTTWNGRNLYICVNLEEDGKHTTVKISDTSSLGDHEIDVLLKLIKYKYVFRRYGIKTISG